MQCMLGVLPMWGGLPLSGGFPDPLNHFRALFFLAQYSIWHIKSPRIIPLDVFENNNFPLYYWKVWDLFANNIVLKCFFFSLTSYKPNIITEKESCQLKKWITKCWAASSASLTIASSAHWSMTFLLWCGKEHKPKALSVIPTPYTHFSTFAEYILYAT